MAQAIVQTELGGPEVLTLVEVPDPVPAAREVAQAPDATATILFDQNHSWNERILTEQFRY